MHYDSSRIVNICTWIALHNLSLQKPNNNLNKTLVTVSMLRAYDYHDEL